MSKEDMRLHLHVVDKRDAADIRLKTFWYDDAEEMNLARIAISQMPHVEIVSCDAEAEPASLTAKYHRQLRLLQMLLTAIALAGLWIGIMTESDLAFAISSTSAVIGVGLIAAEWLDL